MREPCYRFFGFELDPHRLELRASSSDPVPLGRKPFDLLLFLVRNRDRVVARDELLDAIWPDTVVSDGSLSTAVRQIRKVLEEDGVRAPSIRTITRRGYRFVAPVEVLEPASVEPVLPEPVLPEPVLPEPVLKGADIATHELGAMHPESERATAVSGLPPADAPLLGRQALLEQLSSQLRVRAGALFVLEGEPGYGKTCVGQRLVELAEAEHAVAVSVRCQSVPGAPALWPIVQVLRQLVRRLPQAPAIDPGPGQSELIRLLARLGVDYVPDPALEPAAARFMLFDAITRAFAVATGDGRKWFLWLDDLHLADASSVELVSFLVPQLSELGMLMLVTTRAVGSAARPIAGAEHMSLSPLSVADAEALVRALAPVELGAPARAAIVEASAGNPLLLRELVRAAVDAGVDGAADPRHIPRTLAAVVLVRFQALSSTCQRMLTLAACVGDEFGPARLPLDPSRVGPQALDVDWLGEACMAGILAPVPRAASRYRFRHSAFRVAIYEACDAARRAEHHGRLAEQIERESDFDAGTVAELMHHYRAASNHERVFSLARSAAREAAAIGAHDAAQQHLALVTDTEGPRVVDAAGRVELLLQRAQSRAALGADAKELQRTYRQAFDLAKDLQSAELQARAALGYAGCLQFRGHPMNGAPPTREEQRLLEVALRAQADSSVWSVLLSARLGLTLVATADLEEGHRLTRAAVARAEAMGDPSILCQALLQRARALSGPGESRERMVVAEEAIALARRCRFARLERDAHYERSIARLRAGEMDAAELVGLGQDHTPPGDPNEALRRTYWALLVDMANGDLDGAARRLSHAAMLVQRCNPIAADRTLPTYRFELSRLRGDKAAFSHLRSNEVFHYRPAVWMAYPWLFGLIDAGHMRSARAVHDLASRRLDELTPNVFYLPALGVGVWATEVLNDEKRARKLYELLLPYDGEVVTSSDSLFLHGTVAHFLGVAAGVFGQYERARVHFDAAMLQNERLGLRVPMLLLRKARAYLSIREGNTAEGHAALAQLAHELHADRLFGLFNDFPPELRRLEMTMLKRLGSSPPEAP